MRQTSDIVQMMMMMMMMMMVVVTTVTTLSVSSGDQDNDNDNETEFQQIDSFTAMIYANDQILLIHLTDQFAFQKLLIDNLSPLAHPRTTTSTNWPYKGLPTGGN